MNAQRRTSSTSVSWTCTDSGWNLTFVPTKNASAVRLLSRPLAYILILCCPSLPQVQRQVGLNCTRSGEGSCQLS